MRHRIVCLMTVLSAVVPCAAKQEPSPAEIAKLEAKVASLEKRLAKAEEAVRRLQAELKRLQSGQAPARVEAKRKLDVRIAKDNWGGAGTADIQKVLLSAAGETWKHCPNRKVKPILVRRSTSGPISLYAKGPAGEYIIKLDVAGTYWCQFAYQYAHEFVHVLTNFDRRKGRANQWFEESLAEMASVFAIEAMAESWKTRPPYPNWKGYSKALANYAADLHKKPGVTPSKGMTFAQWFQANRESLRRDPYKREKNRTVAHHLLPMFQRDPAGWEAVSYLNHLPADKDNSFESYLQAWHKACPDPHKKFAADVMARFGAKPAP